MLWSQLSAPSPSSLSRFVRGVPLLTVPFPTPVCHRCAQRLPKGQGAGTRLMLPPVPTPCICCRFKGSSEAITIVNVTPSCLSTRGWVPSEGRIPLIIPGVGVPHTSHCHWIGGHIISLSACMRKS